MDLGLQYSTNERLCRLSAHLYELLGDEKYETAAESAIEFIHAHMYLSNPGIIQDTFTVNDCQFLFPTTFSYSSGFTIWGLSVHAAKNTSWTPLYVALELGLSIADSPRTVFSLNSLISTSIPYQWTNPSDGIIIEGKFIRDCYLIFADLNRICSG